MNFIGIGPLELILVLIVGLVVVGPERLPKLAADLARTIRELRKYTGQFAAEFTDVVKEFEKETAPERGQWKEIGEGLTSASKSVTDATKPIAEAVEGARADAAADVQPKHTDSQERETAPSAPPVGDAAVNESPANKATSAPPAASNGSTPPQANGSTPKPPEPAPEPR